MSYHYTLDAFKKSVEYDKIIDYIATFAYSDVGKQSIANSYLLESKAHYTKISHKVSNCIYLILQQLPFPLQGLSDINGLLEPIEVENYCLSAVEILKIKRLIENIRDSKSFFEVMESHEDVKAISIDNSLVFYDPKLLKTIDEILDSDGQIRNEASIVLGDIREKKTTFFKHIESIFRLQVSKYKSMGYLSDTLETIRNNRRVLAVLSEYKRKVKGIIVDVSESGNITYIEPEETIFLNNEASELDREEAKEIKKILIKLTAFLSKYKKLLAIYQDYLTAMDHWNGLAKYCLSTESCFPMISENNELVLNNAYHPLLKIKNKKDNKPTIPFSVKLSKHLPMLIISGPNAGGKSITLKTIGLISLMVRSGIPIPVEQDAMLPWFDLFFADVGDEQSIDNELSTYSSKLILWKQILANAHSKTLILFDEMGAGTDPSFGAAMAQIILEKCIELGAITIVTTHFGHLKKFGDTHKAILNASMVFDEANLMPMYQLKVGTPGSSFTFHIARKLNIDEVLISKAESLCNTDEIEYDRLLLKIEIKQKELIRKQKELDQQDKELKNQIKNWKRMTNELDFLRKKIQMDKMLFQQELNIEREKSLRQFDENMKNITNREELASERKKIQHNLSIQKKDITTAFKNLQNIDNNKVIHIGQKVQYIQTQAIGIVDKIEKNKAIVIFDHSKMSISLSELIVITADNAPKSVVQTKKIELKSKSNTTELDLRGLFVSEALESLDDFINLSLLDNKYQCKIIHGRGILKKEILKAITSYKQIVKYTHGDPEGESDGVTYIYF